MEWFTLLLAIIAGGMLLVIGLLVTRLFLGWMFRINEILERLDRLVEILGEAGDNE